MDKIKALLVTSSPRPDSASVQVACKALDAAGIEVGEKLDTLLSPPPAYGKELMDAVYGGSKEPQALASRFLKVLMASRPL